MSNLYGISTTDEGSRERSRPQRPTRIVDGPAKAAFHLAVRTGEPVIFQITHRPGADAQRCPVPVVIETITRTADHWAFSGRLVAGSNQPVFGQYARGRRDRTGQIKEGVANTTESVPPIPESWSLADLYSELENVLKDHGTENGSIDMLLNRLSVRSAIGALSNAYAQALAEKILTRQIN